MPFQDVQPHFNPNFPRRFEHFLSSGDISARTLHFWWNFYTARHFANQVVFLTNHFIAGSEGLGFILVNTVYSPPDYRQATFAYFLIPNYEQRRQGRTTLLPTPNIPRTVDLSARSAASPALSPSVSPDYQPSPSP
jgi:hypothetical protein